MIFDTLIFIYIRGFQARVPKADGSPFLSGGFSGTPEANDEVVTIYEIVDMNGNSYAVPSYQFEWPNVTDPNGIHRDFIAYPGKVSKYITAINNTGF